MQVGVVHPCFMVHRHYIPELVPRLLCATLGAQEGAVSAISHCFIGMGFPTIPVHHVKCYDGHDGIVCGTHDRLRAGCVRCFIRWGWRRRRRCRHADRESHARRPGRATAWAWFRYLHAYAKSGRCDSGCPSAADPIATTGSRRAHLRRTGTRRACVRRTGLCPFTLRTAGLFPAALCACNPAIVIFTLGQQAIVVEKW